MSLDQGSLDKAIQEFKVAKLIFDYTSNQVMIKQGASATLHIRNLADSTYYSMALASLLVNSTLTIVNAGAGANPTLTSNSASKIAYMEDSIQAKYSLMFNANTAYYGQLVHVNTANRAYTFPNKNITVADDADITALKSALLIGSANKDYMNTVYYSEQTEGSFKFDVVNYKIINVHTATITIGFLLDLPCNRGGLKLYVDAMRMRVTVANGSNYITRHDIYGIASDGSKTLIDEYTTATNSAEEREDTFTAHDCTGYEKVLVMVTTLCGTLGGLAFDSPQIRAYFSS